MKFLTDAQSMIGKRIRLKRKEMKLTQKNLASSVGVTFQQLQKYESGQSNVSINMLIKLCRILNVDITYFIPKHDNQNTVMNDNYKQIDLQSDEDLEKKLLEIFRLIKSKQTKKSVINLIESVIMTK